MPEDKPLSPKEQEEYNKLKKDGINSERDHLRLLREEAAEFGKIVNHAKSLAQNIGLTVKQSQAFGNSFKNTNNIAEKLVINADKLLKGQISSKDISQQIEKSYSELNELNRQRGIITDKILQRNTNISASTKEQIKNAQNAGQLKNLALDQTNKLTDKEREILLYLSLQTAQNKKNNLELINQEKLAQKIEDRIGVLGKLLTGINKVPIIGQFVDSDKALKRMAESAAQVDKNGKFVNTRFDVLKKGVGSIAEDIQKGISDPLTLIIALFNSGLQMDKSVVEFERSMGISRAEAQGLRDNMSAIASETGNVSINSKDVQATLMGLNKQFDAASSVIRDDIVAEMSKLGKLTNMSAEAQGRFAMFANISGKNAKQITDETRQAVVLAEKESGLRLDINKVLDEAGRITGQIASQLGGNVTKIAEVVATAKQFGMTLEQVAASGAKLLNFEQNISDELEAELLIGKQINLEKARLAALTGDYNTLTKEINKNIGDFSDYSEMNILQQNALAKSVGMTADQLSDVLLKNENIAQLAQEARAAGKNDLADQLEKRDVQQKFNDTMDKLKQTFVDIAGGPIGTLLEALGKTLGIIGKIIDFVGLGKGGFADIVFQVGLFSKLLFGTINPIKGIVTAYKSLTGFMNIGLIKQKAINLAERIGLINKEQAVRARTRENLLQTQGITQEQLSNLHKNAGLLTLIKKNIQRSIGNVKLKVEKGLELGKNAIMSLGNAIRGFGIVQQGVANKKGVFGMLRAGGKAIMSAMTAGFKAPFPVGPILGVALGAIITAAVIGLMAKFGKGNDVFSGPKGGSGYGSRMLLAPEGAFALNNRDTVIAGTNLGVNKANDLVSAEPDTINLTTSSPSTNAGSSETNALSAKLDQLNNNIVEQTNAITQKPVAVNNMVDTDSLVKQQLPPESQPGYTLLT